MLRGVLTICALALAVIPVTLSVVLFAALRLPHFTIDLCARFFGRVGITCLGARLLPVLWHTNRATLAAQLVIVSNHESHVDPAALVLALKPRSVRFVAKEDLFHIPIFGWALRAAGNIPVSRDHGGGDVNRLNDLTARRKDGDVLFFAEGSRGGTGVFRPFKKGAFAFAITHQRTILPVGIGGSFECLPPHSLRARPGPVAIVVGEPISVDGLTLDDRDALRDRVQSIVGELRTQALRLAGSPRAGA